MRKLLVALSLLFSGLHCYITAEDNVKNQEAIGEYIYDIAREIGVRTDESQKIDDNNFFEAPRLIQSFPQLDIPEMIDYLAMGVKSNVFPDSQHAVIKIELDDHGVITEMNILSSPYKTNTQNLTDELSKISLIPAKLNGKAIACTGIMGHRFKGKSPIKTNSRDFGYIYWIIPDIK